MYWARHTLASHCRKSQIAQSRRKVAMTRIPLTASAARVVGRESDAAPGAMSSTPAQDNNTFPDAAADIDQKHQNPPVGGPALPVVSVEEPAEESEDGEEITDNDEDEEHDVADDERLEPGVASEIGLRRRMGGRRDGTKHKIIKIPVPAARVRLPPHPEPSAVPSAPSRPAGKAGQVSRPPEVSSKPGLETLNFWGTPGRGDLVPGGLDGPDIEKDLDRDVQLGDPKSNNKSGQDSRGQNIGRLQDYQTLREHLNKRLQLARLDKEMDELKLPPAIDEAQAFPPLRGSGFPPLTLPSFPPRSVSESVSHFAPSYNPDHPPVPNRNHYRDHPPIPKEPSFQPATTMVELFTKELDKTADRTAQAVTQEIRRTTAEIKDEISELESKYKATAATVEETTGQNTYMMQELYEMRTTNEAAMEEMKKTNAALRDELRKLRRQNEEFKDQIKIILEVVQIRERDRTRMYGASGPAGLVAPCQPGAPNPPSTPWPTGQHPLLQAQCGQFPGSSMRNLTSSRFLHETSGPVLLRCSLLLQFAVRPLKTRRMRRRGMRSAETMITTLSPSKRLVRQLKRSNNKLTTNTALSLRQRLLRLKLPKIAKEQQRRERMRLPQGGENGLESAGILARVMVKKRRENGSLYPWLVAEREQQRGLKTTTRNLILPSLQLSSWSALFFTG
ncbi:hypothetical protein QBC37DRAFT_431242 [Rhypophila decipiens]|uniref:Uncharacterized protein n=1 Tax=Rhypophila decipiens TaxID=261697 RepID=A0AAN6Y3R8_9PEZI|nr:hypothetical protein QBC37DRAFT_431242 [Rhypophila decipiens]